MSRHGLSGDARHRLLESFLWRLARSSDPDAFALRGGMCVRQWFPNAGRLASDIDLVCLLPYDVQEMRRRIRNILATPTDDGVELDVERFRLDSTWANDAHPGMRLVVQAWTDDVFDELHVDFTFNLPVWPHATQQSFRDAQIWVCPPTMLIGRKLRVTSELGRRFWRPKDLADLWLMFRHTPPTLTELGEVIERTCGTEIMPARSLGASSWSEPYAAARWRRFVAQHRTLQLPRDVRPVVQEIRSHLTRVTS